ncbi:hypothetical protein KVT40_005147 [Elsinoe batatas]|uniref:F-box domain-containing protein n=1 Tax=Elsinoe batatas TaxID=2601811 RepID=A0A8K0L0X4_9PEZI|nr:hypothetical protein KVT40_005147 [Elsinoe batatas]
MADKQGAQSKAVAGVMNNTYLLEMVLRHLPMQDLLRCQRVAKDWKALVGSSKALQRKLFLVPIERDIPVVVYDKEAADDNVCVQCCVEMRVIHPPISLQNTKSLSGCIVHPIFLHDIDLTPVTGYVEFRKLDGLLDVLLGQPREPNSWADMFVTPPPCKTIRLANGDSLSPFDRVIISAVTGDYGVRWKQILDHIREAEVENQEWLSERQDVGDSGHYDWFLILDDHDYYPIPGVKDLGQEGRICRDCFTAIRHVMMEI